MIVYKKRVKRRESEQIQEVATKIYKLKSIFFFVKVTIVWMCFKKKSFSFFFLPYKMCISRKLFAILVAVTLYACVGVCCSVFVTVICFPEFVFGTNMFLITFTPTATLVVFVVVTLL